jgi:hypothetical protein
VPDFAKLFHVGALIRHVRNVEGLTHILQHFFACRSASRNSSALMLEPARANASPRARDSRSGRSRGRVGSPAQISNLHGSADDGSIRELPAGFDDLPRNWSTGFASICVSSSIGMCSWRSRPEPFPC